MIILFIIYNRSVNRKFGRQLEKELQRLHVRTFVPKMSQGVAIPPMAVWHQLLLA